MKLVEIASKINLPQGTIRSWKNTHKWDNERSDKKSERSHKNKTVSLVIKSKLDLRRIRTLRSMASLLSIILQK
jgi:uncharacterized protein YjcR